MTDYIQLLVVVNLLATVFYSSCFVKNSPVYKDYLKSLLGTIAVATLGVFIIIYHSIKGQK
jgi:hypothetical protein